MPYCPIATEEVNGVLGDVRRGVNERLVKGELKKKKVRLETGPVPSPLYSRR